MKKTLLTLSLAVLMCALMIVGVSAVIDEENDVGLYIRFSDQATISSHITNHNDWLIAAFDAEAGALRYTPLQSTVGGTDQRLFVNFGQAVDTSKYPYLRITYMVPSIDIKGDATANPSLAVYLYPNNGSITWTNSDFKFIDSWTNNDKVSRSVLQLASGEMTMFRLDSPNFTSAGNWEIYIYDVGLFATPEAAASYNPAQDHYLLDMSVPDNGITWGNVGTSNPGSGTMEYDEEERAWLATLSYGDWRIRSSTLEADNWFSPSEYPYFSTYFAATYPQTATYILNEGYSALDSSGAPIALGGMASFSRGMITTSGSNYGTGLNPNLAPGEWGIGWANLTNATSGNNFGTAKVAAFTNHQADWLNNDTFTSAAPAEDYMIGFKYLAYYPTPEMAQLIGQPAPTTVTGVAPATASGMGALTGLTTDMEYRYTGVGEYIAVASDTIEVAPGATYDVRYKAKEGYNAGYAAQVGVPLYWDFDLTGIAGVEGEVISSTDVHNWKVIVPYGTDISALVPEFTTETGVTTGTVEVRSNPQFITSNIGNDANPQTTVAVVLTSGQTAIDATAGNVLLGVIQKNAIFEYVNVVVEVADFAVDGEMLGAQYRTAEESAEHGEALRFGTKINFTGWENAVTDISYGTLVTSAAALGDNELTHDITENVVDVPAAVMFEEADDYCIFTAAIYGIPATDADTQLVAVGYVKYTLNGEAHYEYLGEVTHSLNSVKAASGWTE